MAEIVVVEVDGEPGWMGDGVDPFCLIPVSPKVARDVATGGEAAAAAAAAQKEVACLDVLVVAVAVAAALVAVAAVATACLDVVGDVSRVGLPDAKATADE